jgi:UDP-GlcNAc:undecaprenyl-phosphate GlcNAc-1-phosphate transferase
MILFSTFLISTIITILLMPIFINLAYKANIMDVPDDRKVHSIPTPRIGGIAMVLGAFIPILLWAPMGQFVKSMLIGSGIIVFFGLVDDTRKIGFKIKFFTQTVAALIVIQYGGLKIDSLGVFAGAEYLLPGWISIPLTLVVIVGVTNALNLSDGLDGLAGGISLISFLCIGYLAYLHEFQACEILSVAMIGAIFGLLRYNTHPAVVFMGDSGSQLLGFFVITTSLAITQADKQLSPVLPLFLVGMPIIDTLWAIFRRVKLKVSPFAADKNHFHHKLMRLGLFHSESVMSIYLLHASFVYMALIFRSKPDWFLLALYFLFSGIITITVFLAVRNNWKISRFDFIDKIIKGRLRILRDEYAIIKFSFQASEIVFIFLLILSCFLPRQINIYFSYSSMAFLFLILLIWFIKKKWAHSIIEISIFLMIPFLVYFGEKDTAYLTQTTIKNAHTLSFGILTIFTLLTLKFTRRHGFKTTPMDILILIFALVIPNLPDERIQSWQMGLVAAKIVVLFFSYEVLKGELRFKTGKLNITAIIALSIVSLRGFIG